MGRRTISLPDSVEALARAEVRPGESFSAAVARLIEAGVRVSSGRKAPSYVASGDGPEELGLLVEAYLRDLVEAR